MQISYQYLLDIIILTWLFIASIYLFKLIKSHRRLFSGRKYENIDEILDEILKNQKISTKEIQDLTNQLDKLKTDAQSFFRYTTFLRYDPFSKSPHESQSFVIVLLNEQKSGILINFIYTNNQYRIYPKLIKDLKPKAGELTKEEQDAINEALKQ